MNKNAPNHLVRRIRAQYTEERHEELDARVKRPAGVFAYVFGSIGAIVMGYGMSLTLTEMGSHLGLFGRMTMPVGIVLVSPAYPLYDRIVKKEREKIAPEILRLTDERMQ